MADVVIFDEVSQRVIRFERSVNTPDYMGRTDVVIFGKNNLPHSSELNLLIDYGTEQEDFRFKGFKVDIKYWKHVNGSIVEMTTDEKAALDDALSTKIISDRRTEATSELDSPAPYSMVMRATWEAYLDEINELRALHGLSNKTLAQFKTAIKNKITSGNAD